MTETTPPSPHSSPRSACARSITSSARSAMPSPPAASRRASACPASATSAWPSASPARRCGRRCVRSRPRACSRSAPARAAAPSSPSRAPTSWQPRSASCCASARRPPASWPSSASRSRPRTPPGPHAAPTRPRWRSSSTSSATSTRARSTRRIPGPSVAALEVRFHDAVARATGNSVRAAIMSAILDALQRAFTAVPVPAGSPLRGELARELHAIVDAIHAGDARSGRRGDARPRRALERPGDRALPVVCACG